MFGVLVERLTKAAVWSGSGWVMVLLLLLSVFSVYSALERVLFFRSKKDDTDALGDRVTDLLEQGDMDSAKKALAKSPSVEAQVILGALRWTRSTPEAFQDAVDAQMGKKKKELERGMNYLGTLGSNAPFIGLFGTVIGVLVAFQQLSEGTDKGSMNNVMGGIAEALITTAVGLFVAIPAVVVYNLFQKWVGDVEGNVSTMSKQITALMRATVDGQLVAPRSAPRVVAQAVAEEEEEEGRVVALAADEAE
jgi:biopolymer transport protein ExbB/biopolymer transport protein TolQ